jgi:hypothetical protein
MPITRDGDDVMHFFQKTHTIIPVPNGMSQKTLHIVAAFSRKNPVTAASTVRGASRSIFFSKAYFRDTTLRLSFIIFEEALAPYPPPT